MSSLHPSTFPGLTCEKNIRKVLATRTPAESDSLLCEIKNIGWTSVVWIAPISTVQHLQITHSLHLILLYSLSALWFYIQIHCWCFWISPVSSQAQPVCISFLSVPLSQCACMCECKEYSEMTKIHLTYIPQIHKKKHPTGHARNILFLYSLQCFLHLFSKMQMNSVNSEETVWTNRHTQYTRLMCSKVALCSSSFQKFHHI